MKPTKHILLTIAMLLCSITASAYDFEVGGIYYNITSDTDLTVEITYEKYVNYSYSSPYSGNVVIPESVTYNSKTYQVTSIGSCAFCSCISLTTITLPESVTSIGSYAFSSCSSLTTINIPASVTSIGDRAFEGCSNLTSITLPENSQLTSIGYQAFYNCSSLTAITLPESVTSIGSCAFEGTPWYDNQPFGVIYVGKVLYKYKGKMPANTSIEVREGTVSISPDAFRSCSSLTTINIPASVTSIGDRAFEGCSNLTSITLPESVTSIGWYAFQYCSSLTAITIPEDSKLTSIGIGAFYNCTSLTAITIPESVTSIGDRAFEGCSNLTSITLPESVTSIGYQAFYNCSSLTTITLPESVTSIGSCAFAGCTGELFVNCNIPSASSSICGAFFNSKFTKVTIGDKVTSIGGYAFSSCSSLTSITIPEGVTSIGSCAFRSCINLTAIILPESVTSIGSCAFEGCSRLTDIYCYAENVPSSDYAFYKSPIGNATLHVPDSALDAYRITAPWSSFGTIVALGASITDITLSQSSATLYEGEVLTLSISVTPSNADMNLISWSSSNPHVATVDAEGKVTAVSTGAATITVTANDGSGVRASCEIIVKEKLLGKCATPVVSYVDGKVMLTCDTEDVEFHSNVVVDNAHEYEGAAYELMATYTITAYATKTKYETSDVVTVTLCWITCTEDHETDDEDGIITIPSQPVLISTQGGTITLTGLAEGTEVTIYSAAGAQLGTATAVSGTATITTSLTTGNTAIVKIGNSSIKVVVK